MTRNTLALRDANCPAQAEPLSAASVMDEHAFQVLYQRTAAPLRAYAVRVLGNPNHADDIVQETYMRFMRTPPPTNDPQKLRAFLFRIASRLMIDRWRSEQRERRRDEVSAENRVERTTEPNIPLRLDIERVFGQLTPQQRQLLWLAYAEGADHGEIALALGLRERSVRVLLHRTRRKVARLLRPNGGEGEP